MSSVILFAGEHPYIVCRFAAGCAECVRRFDCICGEPNGSAAGLSQALLDHELEPCPGALPALPASPALPALPAEPARFCGTQQSDDLFTLQQRCKV